MNIFFLDTDPIIAAQMLCDKHVVKMILECCQMLWTAWHITGFDDWKSLVPENVKIYKQTHSKHPTCMWIRRHYTNYKWTVNHAISISREYTKRYGKVHSCAPMIHWFARNIPRCNDNTPYTTTTVLARREIPPGTTPPPICITDKSIIQNTSLVKSYRNYYIISKSKFATWNRTAAKPLWFIL